MKVTAKDNFRFTLSRTSAPHGKVSFVVTNKGRLKHDFAIAGKKTKMLGHNKTATLTVTLSKGKHRVQVHRPGPRSGRDEGHLQGHLGCVGRRARPRRPAIVQAASSPVPSERIR